MDERRSNPYHRYPLARCVPAQCAAHTGDANCNQSEERLQAGPGKKTPPTRDSARDSVLRAIQVFPGGRIYAHPRSLLDEFGHVHHHTVLQLRRLG